MLQCAVGVSVIIRLVCRRDSAADGLPDDVQDLYDPVTVQSFCRKYMAFAYAGTGPNDEIGDQQTIDEILAEVERWMIDSSDKKLQLLEVYYPQLLFTPTRLLTAVTARETLRNLVRKTGFRSQ